MFEGFVILLRADSIRCVCVLFHTRAGIASARGHMIANRGHVDEGGHACTILCPYHCHRHQNRRQNETIACHVVNSNRGHFNESEHACIIRVGFSVSTIIMAVNITTKIVNKIDEEIDHYLQFGFRY